MANGLFNLKQVVQAVQQGGWPAQKPPAVEYLAVAGGGGGGRYNGGGGGGAGGLLLGIDPVPNGQALLVTVGGGGAGGTNVSGTGQGISGSNSVFGAISAIGGGGGGGSDVGTAIYNFGLSGGSGGGSGSNGQGGVTGGAGTSGQGNFGGVGISDSTSYRHGGGGGGAGTVGLNAKTGTTGGKGDGGGGIASVINGTVTTYAGGGGGGAYVGVRGLGGVGGGGNGGESGSGFAATAGTANTGGGGGGGGGAPGAAGGSGIVIVSYPDVYAAPTATTGSPTVSTSGSGSILFTGTSALTYPSNTVFDLGTGSFTYEAWVYVVSTPSQMPLIGWATGANRVLRLNLTSLNFESNVPTNVSFDVGFPSTLSLNSWSHIALVRNGTVLTAFLNGVAGTPVTYTGSWGNSTEQFNIGYKSDPTYFNGYMSNLRLVKGTAIYTSNFTPSTKPLAVVSGTSLLLNSVSGAFMADGSGNSSSVAVIGSPAWNQLSPFTVTGYKNRVYTWTSSGSITF